MLRVHLIYGDRGSGPGAPEGLIDRLLNHTWLLPIDKRLA